MADPAKAKRPFLTSFGAALGLIAVLLLMATTPALAQNAPPPPVSVAKPVVKPIVERDDFIGRFDAVDTVDLRSRVSGYLDKVNFSDGAVVKAGDLLFTIDQRPYKAALDDAQAAVASAQAGVDFSTGDLERADALIKSGNITGQIADQRRQSALAARATLDRAKAALVRAKLDMEFTEIRAPMAGRISRRLVSVGNLINANDTLLTTMVSLDPIQFYFDADERSFLDYLSDLIPGRNTGKGSSRDVTVALTGETQPTHKGHIDFVDIRLDQASGTMRGRAVFDNKDLSLTPGLFGRISIAGSKSYQGILVPDEALGTDQDRRIIYVVGADNKVTTRVVRTGPRIDGYRVIRDGLKGDETIVVNGLMRVRPGIEVQPKMTELPPSRDPAGG
ncbi:efflux RND transporter periplasmic adaptor subunit [Lichenihabitans psoromatis]|uniref:efflux RND transporter periplasmic adaptor subunit n=1 Tax=Lichenihabitans psoromatis TaxID=2528642 RepID=UPI0010385B35|nr:efflux RND transporter periplasmic adaptor subunit [Lichenihabitans psoromatis]